MPPGLFGKIFALFVFAAPCLGVAALPEGERPFDFWRDRFAFSNETLWAYHVNEKGELEMHAKQQRPQYARRCFVIVRSELQFRKFVHFDPEKPKLDEEGYRRLLRHIARIPAWLPPKKHRIDFPGYADLYSFSKEWPKLCEDNLGYGLPNYFRLGNSRIVGPFPRAWQAKLADNLRREIDAGKTPAIFITRFKPINHNLLVFDYKNFANGDIAFLCYDPNDHTKPREIRYDSKLRSFIFPKTFYYPGGVVNVTRVYTSIFK